MTLQTWSQTADSNDTADSTINWREGQAPRTLNNSARGMMAAVAKYRDDRSGQLVTTGTSTAYSVASNQGYTSLLDGATVTVRLHATSGANPTLNLDTLGDKPINTVLGTVPPATSLLLGGVYTFVYVLASDCFVIAGIPDYTQFVPPSVPTGAMVDYAGTSAPSGWVLASGRTIGDASSAATERANADTSALYTLLWNSFSNTVCPVSSGRGANAAADFGAHKTIGLPDLRGRMAVGKDNMGGSAASRVTTAGSNVDGGTLGASGGEETHTLVIAEMPSHNHAITDPGHTHTYTQNIAPGFGSGGTTNVDTPHTSTTSSATTGIALANTGGGGVHNNMPPAFVINKVIKL